MPTPRTGKEPYLSCRACSPLRTTPSCWRWMMSVLANTAQRLCQLALMRGEPAAAQRAVLEQRQLDGARAHVNSQLEHSFLLLLDKSN